MRRLVSFFRSLLVAGAVAYLAVLVFLFAFQESILFPAGTVPLDQDYGFPQGVEDLWIERPDGARLHAVRFRTGGPKGVALYFHGNGATIGKAGWVNAIYEPLGYDVIALDYRGYGKSRGDRSEQAMLEDALAFYDQMVAQGDDAPLIVGRSLGTVFATYVAAHRPASQLILYAPPSSIAEVAGHHYPWVPIALLRFPFPTKKFAAQVSAPILVFHGTEDQVIPFESGRSLSKSLKPADQFIPVPGGGHNDIPWRPDVIAHIQEALSGS